MNDRFRVSRLVAHQLRANGIPEVAVLRRAGLWDGWLRQERIMATTDELFAFWRAVEEVSGNPTVGLRIGPHFSVEGGTPQTIAAIHSESFRDAIQRIARYKRLTCPEEIRLSHSGDESSVEFVFLRGGAAEPAVLVDICLSWILDIGRRGSGTKFSPLRLELGRDPGHCEALEEYYGCRIRFNAGRNALVFRTTDLDRPFITHNPERLELLVPQMDAELAATSSGGTLVDEVRRVTRQLLPGKRPALPDVARLLGMGTRTLQRHLTDLEITFQQILQHVRQEMARQYLAQKSLDLKEVGFLVGFDDTNSFLRAFHRWEGVTPSQWRSGLKA